MTKFMCAICCAAASLMLFAGQNAVSKAVAATHAGKTAVITGAASGMGPCMAKSLAAAGATVFMLDINGEGVEREVAAINALGNGNG